MIEKQQTSQPVIITIHTEKTYQSIEHFGASDAWACQFVGNWPEVKKNAIADLLFSQDTLANGQPKGIGLSLWRFNIGAGSTEQGTQSGIADEWRRAESFLNADGTYNWNKQAGQVWFLEAAKTRGVNAFLAFPNSPPVQLTANGKAFANNGKTNLPTDRFAAFSKFLADVISGIKQKTGITFNYLSPVNEPQWDWSDGGQEGTPFYNNEVAQITRLLSKSLTGQKLGTKINIAEAGQIDYLYANHNKEGRQNQIYGFFDKSSSDYVGDLPNLTKAVSGHSYFTTSPYQAGAAKRAKLAAAISSSPGLSYWMSEYCILGDNEGEIKGEGRDLGMNSALYVAKVIHSDLVNAGASAWHWWLALSAYDYKDGLIYVDKNKTDGDFKTSKMLWALGHYSRFVRPGAVRAQVSLNAADEKLLVSTYINQDGQLVTVVVNTGDQPKELLFTSSGSTLGALKAYQTSEALDMEPMKIPVGKPIVAGPKSIMTVIGR